MITVAVVFLSLVAVTGLIGGVVMTFGSDGSFWSRYMGYNAITGGLELLVKFGPAAAECIGEILGSLK